MKHKLKGKDQLAETSLSKLRRDKKNITRQKPQSQVVWRYYHRLQREPSSLRGRLLVSSSLPEVMVVLSGGALWRRPLSICCVLNYILGQAVKRGNTQPEAILRLLRFSQPSVLTKGSGGSGSSTSDITGYCSTQPHLRCIHKLIINTR